jgi:RNA polymerase sigma-70 factor (ECF subfamily)
MQETKLINGCIAGERKTQNELYALYAGKFYGICLRYASCRDEADDLLQEGFIKIFNSLQTYRFQGSFEGWMKRIIINTALNFIRTQEKQVETALWQLPDEEMTESSEEEFDSGKQLPLETMLKLIQELPAGYRMVFNLYVFENQSHKQIAEMTGISENTSKTQLMRARKSLQKKISEIVQPTILQS